jgi:hypothetical protein
VFVQKWCISPEFKAGSEFKPEEYWVYFEDLNLLPNVALANARNRVRGAVSGRTLGVVAQLQLQGVGVEIGLLGQIGFVIFAHIVIDQGDGHDEGDLLRAVVVNHV